MSWPAPMPIVELEWHDSHAHGTWRSVEDWRKELEGSAGDLLCRSVGWLFFEDDARVVLFQSQSASGNLSDAIDIPKTAIRSRRVVEAARTPEDPRGRGRSARPPAARPTRAPTR